MATIYCMNCGIELNEDARFCPECGSPTLLGAGLVEPGGQAQVACPACGALNDSTNKHCAECGAALWQPKPDLRESTTAMRIQREREEYATGESRKRTLLYGGIAGAAVLPALPQLPQPVLLEGGSLVNGHRDSPCVLVAINATVNQ